MKQRYFLYLVVGCFICFLLSSRDLASEQTNQSTVESGNQIIFREYPGYSRRGPANCVKANYPAKTSKIRCHSGYYANDTEAPTRHYVIIDLYVYDDTSTITDEALEDIVRTNQIDRGHPFKIDEKIGISMRYHATGQSFNWISNDIFISIGSSHGDVPDIFLDAYLAEYPPSPKLKPEDIAPQNFYKRQQMKDFEFIREKDKDRKSDQILATSKRKQYEAMISQCVMEISIRCQVGLYSSRNDVSCPTSFILDDKERGEGWNQLENEAKGREIILDNINFNQAWSTKCGSNINREKKKIVKVLKMDQSDIDRVRPEIQPEP